MAITENEARAALPSGHSGQFSGPGYMPENYLFGAYGEYVENSAPDTLDDDPPFYQVAEEGLK